MGHPISGSALAALAWPTPLEAHKLEGPRYEQSQSWQRRQYSNKAGIYPSSSSSKIAALHGARCRVRQGEQCHGLMCHAGSNKRHIPKAAVLRLRQRKSYCLLVLPWVFIYFFINAKNQTLGYQTYSQTQAACSPRTADALRQELSNSQPRSLLCVCSHPAAERKTNAANSLVCSTLCFELFTATPIGRKKHFSLGHNEEHISST